MVEQVVKFLEGAQPYEVGCSLLFSINPHIARNLQRHESDLNKATLNYQLKLWLKEQPVVTKPVKPTRTSDQVITKVFNEERVSGIKKQFSDDWKEAYRERGHLHGRLHQAKNNADRYKIAQELFAVQARIDRMNSEKAKLDEGVLPERYLREKLTAEQYKNITNAKYYIRRYKQQLDQAETTSAKNSIREKIEKWELKLKSYE